MNDAEKCRDERTCHERGLLRKENVLLFLFSLSLSFSLSFSFSVSTFFSLLFVPFCVIFSFFLSSFFPTFFGMNVTEEEDRKTDNVTVRLLEECSKNRRARRGRKRRRNNLFFHDFISVLAYNYETIFESRFNGATTRTNC